MYFQPDATVACVPWCFQLPNDGQGGTEAAREMALAEHVARPDLSVYDCARFGV